MCVCLDPDPRPGADVRQLNEARSRAHGPVREPQTCGCGNGGTRRRWKAERRGGRNGTGRHPELEALPRRRWDRAVKPSRDQATPTDNGCAERNGGGGAHRTAEGNPRAVAPVHVLATDGSVPREQALGTSPVPAGRMDPFPGNKPWEPALCPQERTGTGASAHAPFLVSTPNGDACSGSAPGPVRVPPADQLTFGQLRI